MLPIALTPPLAKTFISISAPWLISSATIGGLLGYTTANNQKNDRKIEQLELKVQQKFEENNKQFSHTLQEFRQELRHTSQAEDDVYQQSDKSEQKHVNNSAPVKTSFLKRLLQSNLKLRQDTEQ